jgi:hypothetical protein
MAATNRSMTGVRGSVIVLGFIAAAACARDPAQKGDAATDHSGFGADVAVTTGGGGSSAPVIVIDAGPPRPPEPPPDAQPTAPADVTFPDPAPMSCSADAGDQGGCEFAPAACATITVDDGGAAHGRDWLVYYDNPRCVDGHCMWDRLYYQCSYGRCLSGACYVNITAIAAP